MTRTYRISGKLLFHEGTGTNSFAVFDKFRNCLTILGVGMMIFGGGGGGGGILVILTLICLKADFRPKVYAKM